MTLNPNWLTAKQPVCRAAWPSRFLVADPPSATLQAGSLLAPKLPVFVLLKVSVKLLTRILQQAFWRAAIVLVHCSCGGTGLPTAFPFDRLFVRWGGFGQSGGVQAARVRGPVDPVGNFGEIGSLAAA